MLNLQIQKYFLFLIILVKLLDNKHILWYLEVFLILNLFQAHFSSFQPIYFLDLILKFSFELGLLVTLLSSFFQVEGQFNFWEFLELKDFLKDFYLILLLLFFLLKLYFL